MIKLSFIKNLNQTGIPEKYFQFLQQSFWNSKDLVFSVSPTKLLEFKRSRIKVW